MTLTHTVIDDDSATLRMLVLSTTTVEVMEGDETGATYTVRLGTEPSATTTVVISGYADTDLNLSVESLTFTTSRHRPARESWLGTGALTPPGAEYAGETADLAVTAMTATARHWEHDHDTARR